MLLSEYAGNSQKLNSILATITTGSVWEKGWAMYDLSNTQSYYYMHYGDKWKVEWDNAVRATKSAIAHSPMGEE